MYLAKDSTKKYNSFMLAFLFELKASFSKIMELSKMLSRVGFVSVRVKKLFY